MEKIRKPTDQQGEQNDNEIIQAQTPAVCSPEFANGCTDVEPDEPEK
ncbi:MAG: hypothetical protein AAGU75_18735 [Bacillota bacterium]